jgi:hypothetical protein
VNGRLYDSESMNEIGNHDKPRLHFWWQMTHGETLYIPIGNVQTYQYTTEDGD